VAGKSGTLSSFLAKPTLLVADDDPMIRRALRRELGVDFDVLEADGLASALRALDDHPGICAVVSDLDMLGDPGAGLALLDEVRQRLPACARIMISGSLDSRSIRVGQILAVTHETFSKPWRSGEVLATLRRLTTPRA